MPAHDIIDNRNQKLAEHIRTLLASSETARFAVGYFFLSGFEAIADRLDSIGDLKLLIGNVTNSQTLEQMSEGYRRLELVADRLEKQAYTKREDSATMADRTAENMRQAVEVMDQTDEGEVVLRRLVRMIEEGRLHVKVYTRGRLHAKAYIFDYGPVYGVGGQVVERHEHGIAVVGSSNLTLSGVTHNTELNVIVQGNDNHAELVRWFDELWDEAEDFDETLMQEMKQSWALAEVRPYDIYMKTLYELVKDRLDGEDAADILWDDEITRRLAEFQKVAVRVVCHMIRDYGGGFVADVVGLGKSFVGAAVIRQFKRTEGVRPIIVCPAALVEMWERYNAVFDLGAVVFSMGKLTEDQEAEGTAANPLLSDEMYADRDFVLIDESHNFRNTDTQRYRVMEQYLRAGKKCCFLTATPRAKSAWDVHNQMRLFLKDDIVDLPIDPPSLKEYFNYIEKGARNLPDLLRHILYRRRRRDVLKWYGYDSETHERVKPAEFDQYVHGARRAYIMVGDRREFFPTRELRTIEYSIEDTYSGLYQQIRSYLGRAGTRVHLLDDLPEELTYARYGLWHYVMEDRQEAAPYDRLKRAGANLRGLMRTMLFKRFESSVHAFRVTIGRMLHSQRNFLVGLDQGIVAAGEDARAVLYASDYESDADLVDALREVTGQYRAADFDIARLRSHIAHDIRMLEMILSLVSPIGPEADDKLQTLLTKLRQEPLCGGKRLIFTQFSDTAQYLYDEIAKRGIGGRAEVIYSGDKSKSTIVGRFSPKSNPEFAPRDQGRHIDTLVATDVLAEGLNLQDCDQLINYDLHWNPVRLIQRLGRIDRIGSDHDVIRAYNFLPETGIEQNLGLKATLANRIREIHETIGEDAAILDPSEQVNEDSLYAVYEERPEQLSLFEDGEDDFIDLNEAEEIMRLLRRDDPNEFQRLADLRDGIRTGRTASAKGVYVFCRAGRYDQLVLVDEQGEVISRDLSRVLSTIRCEPEEAAKPLPEGYNAAVMRVLQAFAEDVRHRETQRDHAVGLSHAQRYIQRQLRILFEQTEDPDMRGQLNILDKAFRQPLPQAVTRELNPLRRNGVTGPPLLTELARIYQQHDLRSLLDRVQTEDGARAVPRIVCSEGLR